MRRAELSMNSDEKQRKCQVGLILAMGNLLTFPCYIIGLFIGMFLIHANTRFWVHRWVSLQVTENHWKNSIWQSVQTGILINLVQYSGPLSTCCGRHSARAKLSISDIPTRKKRVLIKKISNQRVVILISLVFEIVVVKPWIARYASALAEDSPIQALSLFPYAWLFFDKEVIIPAKILGNLSKDWLFKNY